jgi:hypothetical protein
LPVYSIGLAGWGDEMRIDQVAYYCSSGLAAEVLKRKLGLHNSAWIKDVVTAKSWVWGQKGKIQINTALLQFNYALGIEFEIIRYLSGPNWQHARNPLFKNTRFFSHVGAHLDDDEKFPPPPGLLVQETWTQKHTAEFLTTGPAAGRTYHYRIYEVGPGAYIKYIKRMPPK